MERGSQDGRVRRSWTHFLLLTHQNYDDSQSSYLWERSEDEQKRFSTPNDKERTTVRWVERQRHSTVRMYTSGLAIHKKRNTIITEVLPRLMVCAPYWVTHPKGPTPGRWASRTSSLKPVMFMFRRAGWQCKTEIPFLKDIQKYHKLWVMDNN